MSSEDNSTPTVDSLLDTSSDSSDNKKSGNIIEEDGELGYFSNNKFVCLTNFKLECVSFLTDRNDEARKPYKRNTKKVSSKRESVSQTIVLFVHCT